MGTKDNFIPAVEGSIIRGVGELEKGAEVGTKDNFIPAGEGSIIRRVGELEKGAEVGTKDNFIPAVAGSIIRRVGSWRREQRWAPRIVLFQRWGINNREIC